MINAMVNSAINDGHIKLYIKDTMRPILGINDLCESIRYILASDEDKTPECVYLTFSDSKIA